MPAALYWNTVAPVLRSGLEKLMAEIVFQPFRIVGGTSLSLQIGHRYSIDLDLFTDAPYGSVDFQEIHQYLLETFDYVSPANLPTVISMGMSYFIGSSSMESFKLDLYYSTESFAWKTLETEGIRMAAIEEIIAMKLDIIARGGRKKDFWDLHELLNAYTVDDMIAMHDTPILMTQHL